jgi:hypothetical protein
MPGFILHVGAAMTCTHGAPGQVAPMQPRVFVMGQPAAPFASVISVAGCPFQIPVGAGTMPQPCILIKWMMPSARVMVMGQPLAVIPSPGAGPALCMSVQQIPAGPPQVSVVQSRVIAM